VVIFHRQLTAIAIFFKKTPSALKYRGVVSYFLHITLDYGVIQIDWTNDDLWKQVYGDKNLEFQFQLSTFATWISLFQKVIVTSPIGNQGFRQTALEASRWLRRQVPRTSGSSSRVFPGNCHNECMWMIMAMFLHSTTTITCIVIMRMAACVIKKYETTPWYLSAEGVFFLKNCYGR